MDSFESTFVRMQVEPKTGGGFLQTAPGPQRYVTESLKATKNYLNGHYSTYCSGPGHYSTCFWGPGLYSLSKAPHRSRPGELGETRIQPAKHGCYHPLQPAAMLHGSGLQVQRSHSSVTWCNMNRAPRIRGMPPCVHPTSPEQPICSSHLHIPNGHRHVGAATAPAQPASETSVLVWRSACRLGGGASSPKYQPESCGWSRGNLESK